MNPIIPERLETARLTLRRPEPSDLEPFIRFYQSDRSRMAMGPLDRADAFKTFCLELGLWAIKGFGSYTLLLNEEPIGLAGIWHPEDWDEPEIGWLLWDGYEGHGYATEAVIATRDMVEYLGWPAPVSYIDPSNRASKAVAQRAGATFESLHKSWPDTEVWRHRTKG